MLGETYEMITEHVKFVAEKVQHTPDQIIAFRTEALDYIIDGYEKVIAKLGFGGGKGML